MKLNPLSWFKTAEPKTITLAAKPERKSIGYRLKRSRMYRAEMQLDNIEMAIKIAEDLDSPRRGLLLDLYHQAVDDGHLSSLIQQRQNQTLMEAFAFFKGDNIDEEATAKHKKTWFYKMIRHILETYTHGHSLVEPIVVDGEVDRVYLIPREHVRPETGEIVLDLSDEKGIPFRSGQVANMVLEFGEPYDLGILKKALKYVAWKRFAQVDWSRYSEKFGMPAMFLRTKERRAEELDKKEEMMANFGANLWAIVDSEDEIEKLETTNRDAYEVYNQNIERNNSELSKLILGQTMTSDNGSSKSQAEVHERVLDSYAVADMRMVAMAINEIYIPWALVKGLVPPGLEFDWLINRADDEDDKNDAEQGGEAGKKPEQGKPKAKPSQLSAKVNGLYHSDCCEDH